ARFDACERGRVLVKQALAVAYALGGDRTFEVLPDRTGEFRLAAIGFDHAGIRLHAGKGTLESIGRDAGGQRLYTKLLTPFAEAGLGGFDDGICNAVLAGLVEPCDVTGQAGLRKRFRCAGDDQAHCRAGNEGTQKEDGNEGVMHAPVSKASTVADLITLSLAWVFRPPEGPKPPSRWTGRLRGDSCLCLFSVFPGDCGTGAAPPVFWPCWAVCGLLPCACPLWFGAGRIIGIVQKMSSGQPPNEFDPTGHDLKACTGLP